MSATPLLVPVHPVQGIRRLLRRVADGRAGAVPVPVPPALDVGSGCEDIDTLYHHRRLELVRLAVLLVDDVPTAEDVVQDAFTAVYRRHGPRLAGLDNPEGYLRRCVVNAARSVLRRGRTVRSYVPPRTTPAPPPEEEVLLREEHREVLHALRRLTHRQRQVIVLRYRFNLSEVEIADTLGLSRGTVKSTASRGLAALARRLEEAP
ncbi:SigE family RNA polymerase sigma factor [Streptomyces coelicoflavus]|uniref:SigE family RNA polymerase sigma factor n=1 Tax=Streptomyces coelicoflavus TaxID=285562 RepID=A0A6N9UIL4_9ACTN|nr:SigE family RNA polymerase sigma factor [Streptomyces coelicoflavus]NEB15973.1 SigE family RNA polymerase sigma factor [Streptomyces coelicoflavus]